MFASLVLPILSTASLCLANSVHDPRARRSTPAEDGKQNDTTPDPDYHKKHVRYVSFGDSWSSGVNYGPPDPLVEYDFPDQAEICRCRRVVEAWPNQLQLTLNNASNSTEAPGWLAGRHVELDFQACYGSLFENVTDQVARMNQTYSPDFGTLMIGGNPGGFADILIDCVYLPEKRKDYGPEYPNKTGECWKTIARANKTVESQAFIDQALLSVAQILTSPMVKKNPEFKLYIISYATLFNADDDACDNLSFGYWKNHMPRVTKELRRAINGIIDKGRDLYDRLFNGLLFGDAVQYVDIDSLFDGHRFCEPTLNGTLQEQNDESWLYNFQWPSCWVFLAEDDDADVHALPSLCRVCGSLWDYTNFGEFMRPFHPKPVGHVAIKDHVIRELSKFPPKASNQDVLEHGSLREDL